MKDEPPYSPAAAGADGWLQIVGIVADARNDGLRNPIKPAFYVPYTLKMRMFTQILVRTRVPPLSILRDVRAELVRVDREQQVMRVRDLQGWITNLPEYAQQRLVARLFGIFSMLALALSAVGLYSVVSYGVATRTNEFGIRMALGARARDVVRMVLSGTSWNVGAGLLAGVLLCLVFDKVASQWVTESSRDPLILGGVTAPAAGRRRHGVSRSRAPRGVDRSDGRGAPRVEAEPRRICHHQITGYSPRVRLVRSSFSGRIPTAPAPRVDGAGNRISRGWCTAPARSATWPGLGLSMRFPVYRVRRAAPTGRRSSRYLAGQTPHDLTKSNESKRAREPLPTA